MKITYRVYKGFPVKYKKELRKLSYPYHTGLMREAIDVYFSLAPSALTLYGIRTKFEITVIAFHKGIPIGWSTTGNNGKNNCWTYVKNSYRRNGIATALIKRWGKAGKYKRIKIFKSSDIIHVVEKAGLTPVPIW